MRKKKLVNEIEQKEKKSRAKYQCRTELEVLIEQANLVPFGITMPDFEAEMRDFEAVTQGDKKVVKVKPANKLHFYYNGVAQSAEDAARDRWEMYLIYNKLRDRITTLPKNFVDFLEESTAFAINSGNKVDWININRLAPAEDSDINPNDVLKYWYEFIKQYVEYCDMRNSIIELIQTYERKWMRLFVKMGVKNPDLLNTHDFSVFPDDFQISIKKTIYKRNVNGTYSPTGLAALIGKVDTSRLRMCEICNKIFWANYKNSFTCSKPCLNALRQRRHRKKNKEAINTKRRENYKRNKKLAQIMKNKNGTL